MPIQVPYLPKEYIERDAAALLAEFSHQRGVAIEPPIPIEDIIEKHLKLGIEFDDTHRRFGMARDPERDADILGAVIFDIRRIVIDDSLAPEENRSVEGRYRFTLAHEGGHWRLHRHLFGNDPGQSSLFGEAVSSRFICRKSQAKEPVEWQADYYASCLLMPASLVLAAWRDQFGNGNPRRVSPRFTLPVPPGANDEAFAVYRQFQQRREDEAFNSFVRPLADKFEVSMVAMRIRLEGLDLLHRGTPPQRSFSAQA